jgi:benzoyl-CoA reductase subunit B
MKTESTGGKTNRLRSATILSKIVDNFYDELREAPKKGKLVSFCDGFPLPFPILVAMDIAYLFGDAYSATVAARHQEKDLQQVAEDHGYNVEICSYTRNAMGCLLYPEEKRAAASAMYQMPKPDMILCTDPGCSMLINWADDTRRRTGKPTFVIQIPHVFYRDQERDAVEGTAEQLREAVTFVEDVAHRKLDWDRLKAIMASVKEATTLRKEAMDLCKATPSPGTFFDWASALGGVNYMLGKPECTQLYEAMRDEVAGRVAKKEAAVLGERYRLYWDGIACWPKLGHLAQKFANLGACVVAGRYTNLGFYSRPDLIDPDHPLESLAENAVALHLNHDVDWIIDNVSQLCQDFALDGLVMHGHRTCRSLAAVQLEVMDGVSRRLGIPGVFFEADIADETFYSDAQVDTRLQALVESIDAKRRRT